MYPQRVSELKIISWNVNGIYTKLEKQNVLNVLTQYDIISLLEVKTSLPVQIPGYISYRGAVVGSAERGGVVVCLRNSLSRWVHSVDVSNGDQVWMRLRNVPGVLLCFGYIPPSDSPYFSSFSFASIQEKMYSCHAEVGYLIVGDMNARFGSAVRGLLTHLYPPHNETLSYPIIADDVNVSNANLLSSLCADNNLVVINNLKTPCKHFVGEKTFRKGQEWVSELDTCVSSLDLLNFIDDFRVLQQSGLPSDHAPVSVTITSPRVNLDQILEGALALGDHSALHTQVAKRTRSKKPVRFTDINIEGFGNAIADITINLEDDVDIVAETLSNELYKCAERCRNGVRQVGNSVDNMGKWERILQDKDDGRVWKAIDWKGNFDVSAHVNENSPSDEIFKEHFEKVLNPQQINSDNDISTDVQIPILDDPITPAEICDQIKKMKVDKACGPDGVSPGIFSLLPAHLILTIATLFNNVFLNALYPQSWTRAKIFTIFKKGDRMNPDNYRGISVTNTIAKVYDMVLCRRMGLWYTPCREQAGAQPKRGCTEHIVTLRLITDSARRKKYKLFVAFVDFSKAYDVLRRDKLFTVLKRLGCGMIMLAAICAMYQITESILGCVVITSTVGVRQGLSTSCLLFIIYVDDLIKMMREKCTRETFIDWLHILLFMDDTVLLATSRANMMKKLCILNEFCDEYGMRMNASKTKFFVICGGPGDAEPFQVGDKTVEHCSHYIYLGSPFTCDGSVSSAVKLHARNKLCHVLKFVSFVRKNNDIPFIVKRRVFDAALLSSLLYGSESWVGADLKPITKLYIWAMKELLNVRRTTPNIVWCAELGYPTLVDWIQHKQHKFYHEMWSERMNMFDDPLIFAIRSSFAMNTPAGKLIAQMVHTAVPHKCTLLRNVHDAISHSVASRCLVYKMMNPDLAVHDIYTTRHTINDIHRVSFTRFRVSGHSLAVETGRWNRRGRGRLPLEERVCVCGDVQTEQHVAQHCPHTQHLRQHHGFSSIQDLFSMPNAKCCDIIHKMLQLYC